METTSAGIDPRLFRSALSKFATGVTIVTAPDKSGEPVGMTANSFNSVSMDPPLILWSVTKTANSAPVFKNAPRFAVHILSADQSDLSNKFARSSENKFDNTEFSLDDQKVPVLAGATARFDCKQWAIYDLSLIHI